MALQELFASWLGRMVGPADTVNRAGGKAYALAPEAALAQYAATGCLGSTYYAGAEEQLGEVLALADRVAPAFLAKVAVYARERGSMKDLPALLLARLSVRDGGLFEAAFPRVVDDARMLRTLVQILRSGRAGRKSLGSRPKRLIRGWLAGRSDAAVFRAATGQAPSLADIVKMVHPRPATPARRALYGYLLGREHAAGDLPAEVRAYEDFKAGKSLELPDLPWPRLAGLPLTPREWARLAERAGWQALRQGLNTLARHGAFGVPGCAEEVAARLAAPDEIARARVFPYQLFMAWRAAGDGVPGVVREALHTAMELAIANVPALPGKVYVLPDVSGSMRTAVTGGRGGGTSKASCLDVAALMAAAILRKNPSAEVLPFSDAVVPVRLEPRDTVMTNAAKLAALPSGGTACSAPLIELNRRGARGELVVFVSDNESWRDAGAAAQGTRAAREWEAFRARNPGARLVLVDLQPAAHTQVAEREDVLNVGGFSDRVFELVADFAAGRMGPAHWVGEIDGIAL